MLAEKVQAGDLPPVDERLPQSPSVYPVPEMIGNYGGTIRRGFKGPSDRTGLYKMRHFSFVHFNPDLSVRPDLVESWDVSPDAKTYTIYLRKGMKWSDGEPFDAKSIMWWYENQELNAELTQRASSLISTGPERVRGQFTATDDYTVVAEFQHPFPLFMHKLNMSQTFVPWHYMQQFHMDFCEDKVALQKEVEDAGYQTWDQYYHDRNAWNNNPERPAVEPWILLSDLTEELTIMERNPYFCAIDPEGNQLPYIDHVNHRLFETMDVFAMWIMNGEIDWQGRHMDTIDYTLLKEGEVTGGYKTFLWPRDAGENVWPNLCPKDERLKEFFGNKDVRKALNVAINREEINDLVFNGLAVPRQVSPTSTSRYYHEEATKNFAFYDPDMANQLFDDAGYTERNSEGFRVWPDGSGEGIFVNIEHFYGSSSMQSDMCEMVSKYWADVGINSTHKPLERSLYEEHKSANMLEASCQQGGHNSVIWLRSSSWLVDMFWQGGWWVWRRDPTDPNAVEPPEDHFVRKLWDIWDRGVMEPDEQKRIDMMREITQIWVDEVPAVGIVGEYPSPVVVKEGIRNFLDAYPFINQCADENLLGSCVLFWEDPENH